MASRISLTDHRGITGSYTGQVNDQMQPNGSGALVYDDGIAKNCIWKDGIPVQGWRSKKKERNHPAPPSSFTSSNNNKLSSASSAGNGTYLHHLDIGDIASLQDMILEEYDPVKIDTLTIHDFAFILRSDCQWTYAIIADRQDDSICFVVDTTGGTKTLSRKHWSTSIRLVNINKQKGTTSDRNVSPHTLQSPMSRLENSCDETLPPPPFWRSSSTSTDVPSSIGVPTRHPFGQSSASIDVDVLSLFD